MGRGRDLPGERKFQAVLPESRAWQKQYALYLDRLCYDITRYFCEVTFLGG